MAEGHLDHLAEFPDIIDTMTRNASYAEMNKLSSPARGAELSSDPGAEPKPLACASGVFPRRTSKYITWSHRTDLILIETIISMRALLLVELRGLDMAMHQEALLMDETQDR